MNPPDWEPCSDRSRERQDPLAGTGSHGDRWLLIEISSAWGRNAFLDPPFDRELGRALVKRIEAAGIRPLAIRRTGRRPLQTRWRWAYVDSRPGLEQVRWGEVDDLNELLSVPLDGSAGVASNQPIFCVCTHARHDQCCAVRGRHVVAELAARFPDETWECSHLGGDRFAGTMVLLPHGLYYGRVDDNDAVEIAEAYLDGRVVDRYLRGRSSLSHAVQAAQHFAREEFGDDRIDAFPPLADERGHGHRAFVRLGTDAGPITVEVLETQSEPMLSTCAATKLVKVREYELGGFSEG